MANAFDEIIVDQPNNFAEVELDRGEEDIENPGTPKKNQK